MLPEFSLEGRTAIVVGGARGLGLEILHALAAAGANVAAVDMLAEQAREATVQAARDFGVRTVARGADVTRQDQIARAFAEIEDALGPVDVLMSAAGIAQVGVAEELSVDEWRRVIDVNLTGMFICAQAAGRRMIARGKGSIILMGSMSGSIVNHPQKQSCYNVSKAGVIMLAKSLATEWAPYGVRVNSISPGYFRTPMTEPVFTDDPERIEAWHRLTPMGRLGQPAELRGLAVFLASDASSYMTGSDLIIDGGYTAW